MLLRDLLASAPRYTDSFPTNPVTRLVYNNYYFIIFNFFMWCSHWSGYRCIVSVRVVRVDIP